MNEYYSMIFDTADNRTLRVRRHDNRDDALKECEELKTFINGRRCWLADRWRVQIMKIDKEVKE